MSRANFSNVKTMQIATSSEDKPWVATVYFIEYIEKYYWLSEPNRRHSEELEKNHNCAVSIVIKEDMPVIGLQAEGTVEQIDDLKIIAKVMPRYIKKYGAGKEFFKRAKLGINKHILYEFTPKRIKIFNETEE